jgi:hypothetical protein
MPILLILVLFIVCTPTRYFTEVRQAGLRTPVIAPDSCIVVKIDTVYNAYGGVVKNYTTKCREHK